MGFHLHSYFLSEHKPIFSFLNRKNSNQLSQKDVKQISCCRSGDSTIINGCIGCNKHNMFSFCILLLHISKIFFIFFLTKGVFLSSATLQIPYFFMPCCAPVPLCTPRYAKNSNSYLLQKRTTFYLSLLSHNSIARQSKEVRKKKK